MRGRDRLGWGQGRSRRNVSCTTTGEVFCSTSNAVRFSYANQKITAVESWFIDPPTGGRFFTNTRVHGITEEDIIGAPSWAETVERIKAMAGGHPLVSYSTFEKSVVNAASTATAALIDLEFIDMLAVARIRISGLENYRLSTVSEHLELPDFTHHDAGDDSRACAEIALALAAHAETASIDALWQFVLDYRAEPKATRNASWYGQTVNKGDLPQANPDADATHPLFGHVACFSGALPGMSRDSARTAAAENGATIDLGVTKKTTILVVGDFDPTTLRTGAILSTKVQKALSLAEWGQPIDVMVASDFLALVED